MSIILWIVFGALAGWIASMLMGSGGGLLSDIIVGIIGAILGGAIMTMLGQGDVSGFNLYSLMVAVLGSVILIAIMRFVRKGSH